MLLNFNDIHKQYNSILPIKGVIHIGAYVGCERDEYRDHGITRVVWFEANPQTYKSLCENIDSYHGHEAHCLLLADKDDSKVEFQVTDNGRGNTGSSSMLKLNKHLVYYPHVKVREQISLKTTRFDSFASKNNLTMSDFNFLNIDVQGAELLVLQGIGELLSNFDYLMIEVNTAELYSECVQLSELDQYLENFNFKREHITMTNREWGDALYVTKRKHDLDAVRDT